MEQRYAESLAFPMGCNPTPAPGFAPPMLPPDASRFPPARFSEDSGEELGDTFPIRTRTVSGFTRAQHAGKSLGPARKPLV